MSWTPNLVVWVPPLPRGGNWNTFGGFSPYFKTTRPQSSYVNETKLKSKLLLHYFIAYNHIDKKITSGASLKYSLLKLSAISPNDCNVYSLLACSNPKASTGLLHSCKSLNTVTSPTSNGHLSAVATFLQFRQLFGAGRRPIHSLGLILTSL